VKDGSDTGLAWLTHPCRLWPDWFLSIAAARRDNRNTRTMYSTFGNAEQSLLRAFVIRLHARDRDDMGTRSRAV
jgi:hypothetical protein